MKKDRLVNVSIKKVLLISFVLITMLFILLAAVWLKNIKISNAHLEFIHDKYIAATHTDIMHDAAVQRAIILLRMALIEDPFERDKEYIQFKKHAERFLKSREIIDNLKTVSEEERSYYEQTRSAITEGGNVQNQAIDYLYSQKPGFKKFILDEVIPAQKRFITMLGEINRIHLRNVELAATDAERNNEITAYLTNLLVFILLVMMILILTYTYIRITRIEDNIIEEHKKAKQANFQKTRFVRYLGHEIQGPITAILGYSELLASDLLNQANSKISERVKNIHIAGEHISDLVSDLLDLSKIEAGKLDMQLSDVVLSDVIREVMAILETSISSYNIKINTVEVTLQDIIIETDPKRLKQVILNIISNAIKYSGENGLVTVFALRDENIVTICIKDNGPGFSPEQKELLFEPFQRFVEKGSNIEGTGLGLSICAGLIKLMGGQIEILSDEGEGSQFNISFPYVFSANQQ